MIELVFEGHFGQNFGPNFDILTGGGGPPLGFLVWLYGLGKARKKKKSKDLAQLLKILRALRMLGLLGQFSWPVDA